MDTHPKHLPADERRAVTVESVVALAGSQNPSEITTAAIAKHMNLTQGARTADADGDIGLDTALDQVAFCLDHPLTVGVGDDDVVKPLRKLGL